MGEGEESFQNEGKTPKPRKEQLGFVDPGINKNLPISLESQTHRNSDPVTRDDPEF